MDAKMLTDPQIKWIYAYWAAIAERRDVYIIAYHDVAHSV